MMVVGPASTRWTEQCLTTTSDDATLTKKSGCKVKRKEHVLQTTQKTGQLSQISFVPDIQIFHICRQHKNQYAVEKP